MSWTLIVEASVDHLRGAAERRLLPLAPISYLPIRLGAAMLHPRQQRQEPAHLDGGASEAIRLGSQLPESRIAEPPETQWDFIERQDVRATGDEESLRRNIHWQWHRTLQHLVTYAAPSCLAIVVFVLTRELGLAAQTAVKLSLACLASATAGHFSRELLTILTGKRRSRHQRSEDDRSS